MRLIYPFDLPKLPYSFTDMIPHISEWTMETHYEVNHRGYIAKANGLLADQPELQNEKLAMLLTVTKGDLFNNIAQHFNHTLWWFSMKPPQQTTYEPTPIFKSMMERDFGSVENWRSDFIEKAKGQFGSGWVWLCLERGKLINLTTSNAGVPNFIGDRLPLLVCDLWEHAYFCDYTTDRAKYIQNWFNLINWQMAEVRLRNEDTIFKIY
jgi:Fe-Mn family superoxide dismutase